MFVVVSVLHKSSPNYENLLSSVVRRVDYISKIWRQYPDGGAVELLSDAVELLLKGRSLFPPLFLSRRQLLSCPLEPTWLLELDTQTHYGSHKCFSAQKKDDASFWSNSHLVALLYKQQRPSEVRFTSTDHYLQPSRGYWPTLSDALSLASRSEKKKKK